MQWEDRDGFMKEPGELMNYSLLNLPGGLIFCNRIPDPGEINAKLFLPLVAYKEKNLDKVMNVLEGCG